MRPIHAAIAAFVSLALMAGPLGAQPGPGLPAWDTVLARQAIEVLETAPAHGLDAAHYGSKALAQRLASGDATVGNDLTGAMLRYFSDLHGGRARLGGEHRPDDFDPAAHLRQALQERDLQRAAEAAAPRLPIYKRVQASLQHYRVLADAEQPWQVQPLPGKLVDGKVYPRLGQMRARLRLLGDLPDTVDGVEQDRHGPDLTRALKQFQSRHGLAETGQPGPETLAALAVPLAQRVVQLSLTLERLRWLPSFRPGRIIVVNVAAYRLWAFDTAAPAEPLEMRVIVGKAAATPTPLFIGQMRYLEFNPYWNVPPSIALAEIAPKMARDSAYLAKNNMELVTQAGQIHDGGGARAIADLRAGRLRVRQRPGPHNVLGAVKFALPNSQNIFLHSTSARELFGRTRRDLSHGCIRLERPAELAQFVLADQPQWSAEAVAAAMAPGPQQTVKLAETIPVVLFYATAATDRNGRTLFARDIYQLDDRLARALRQD